MDGGSWLCLTGASGNSVQCEICKKYFHGNNCKYLLKRHMITHSGEKPFKCPFCPHRANIKQNLDMHIKRRHIRSGISSNSTSLQYPM